MSEDKKKSITVALLGNEPKPLLCKVAVVTPKFRDFMNWVDINQKKEKLTLVLIE
jgi:hypothetical protein